MKLRTRKLLAGLLSFGMLLQAASPLSALAAETPTVASSVTVYDGFSRLYTSVTYVLNRYTDGSVRWEDDKNPWDGVDVSYDTSSNTYVFSGTLSVPADGTGHTATLICSDPQNDSIKIDGGDSVAVNTSLQIGVSDQTRGAKNVTVLANSNSTAINGGAAFDCYGDVTITNPSGAVTSQYDGIVVYDNAKDIVITGKSDAPLIGGSFSSYSSGNITIENPDGADVRTNLSISEGAAEVKLTGSDSNGLVLFRDSSLSTFKIKAKTLTMENKSGPVGPVEFTRTDTTSAYRVAVGESESSNVQTELTSTTYSATVDAEYLNIQPGTPENTTVKHTLTLKYAEAYEGETKLDGTAGENGTTTYTVEDGKELTIKAVAPGEHYHFTGWTESSETSEKINVTVHENMTLTANWEKVTDQATDYGIKVTIGNNSPIEVNSKNCGHILGDNNDKLTYNPDTYTLTGKGSFGEMKVEITDDLEDKVDVVLRNANGAVVNGSLTVTGAKDVKVMGVSSTALITRDATITCAGDILMDNAGVGNVLGYGDNGNLDVESAQNVTIHGVGRTDTEEDGSNYTIYGEAEIACNGDVEITSQNGGAVWDPVVITKADNVTITANQRAVWDSRSYLDSSIHCSGKVKITSETAAALHDGKLTITGATDVTISGDRDDGATIGGDAEITCSGPVVLENTGSGNAVSGKLKYTPDPSTKPYEIKAGTDAADAASKEPVETMEEGGTFSETVDASYISIAAVSTPTDVPGDDDFTGGDSGAGGAVAAVVVGGAAVWGGYEIATRVILHNILPEGAAIPANRGQLALLVWNTAGRPEPVNTPAFADVADADTAKAAQWCVEQGLMEAKSESTFKPEGWMPKFKTIEVWEKAFPKQ